MRLTVAGEVGVAPGMVEPGRLSPPRGVGIPERGVGMRLLLALRLRKAGEDRNGKCERQKYIIIKQQKGKSNVY